MPVGHRLWRGDPVSTRPPAEPSLPPPDRPDCVEGRVCFVFYSHLKNVKEVYVTTTLDRQAQAVRGQVGTRGWGPGLLGQRLEP